MIAAGRTLMVAAEGAAAVVGETLCIASIGCGLTVLGVVVVAGVTMYVLGYNKDANITLPATTGSVGGVTTAAGMPDPDDEDMVGSKGTKVSSKTLWRKEGFRIDVENPNPGQRSGQIHFQDSAGNKYIYDIVNNTFRGAPNSVNKLLNDPSVQNAISKGLRYLGEI